MSQSAVAAMRISYTTGTLLESTAPASPYLLFATWFKETTDTMPPPFEVNAMTLSTANAQGRPSARIVLLKAFDITGFTFFTNYLSHKAQDLDSNPFAGSPFLHPLTPALTFYWSHDTCSRQVRVTGMATRISSVDSDIYFHSRPRGSQIGAWSSMQSSVVDGGRDEIERIARGVEEKFEGVDVIPRPEWWGGYRIDADMVEFWQGRESRLHDRLEYTKKDEEWVLRRLSP